LKVQTNIVSAQVHHIIANITDYESADLINYWFVNNSLESLYTFVIRIKCISKDLECQLVSAKQSRL